MSATLFRSTASGVGFLPCERNSFAGEWAKPFWLARAQLGPAGIHLPGIDSVVVGALVSYLLQVEHMVLFFGRLK